jgi:hypothetical protein
MSSPRLQSLTKIYLAVVYGVVGLTGESLHYLAASPMALWTSPQPGEVVVYYHTHGPDYHGHFHRHVHTAGHSHAVPSTSHKSRTEEHSAKIGTEHIAHEPHACPLLSLVSTLKLGNADCGATFVIFGAIVTPTFERDCATEIDVSFSSSARGPPAHSFA